MAKENIEEIKKELMSIDNIRDKLGETVYDFISEEDNFTHEIGKYVLNVFCNCKTNEELEIADNMLIAICGYGIETVMDKIQERDIAGYIWESII